MASRSFPPAGGERHVLPLFRRTLARPPRHGGAWPSGCERPPGCPELWPRDERSHGRRPAGEVEVAVMRGVAAIGTREGGIVAAAARGARPSGRPCSQTPGLASWFCVRVCGRRGFFPIGRWGFGKEDAHTRERKAREIEKKIRAS